ncbi:MAG TPA: carboxypeptidase-like regulatory domain-containing protein, partial [Bryobacteraceae bacterium]|nr:carboxypeptidase-like regulatory domain-containing protein [Bryobacteraceae bacterium]
ASVGLLCLFAIGAFAQTSPPSSGAISGIVLDAASNSPIRRAIVTLSTIETQPQDAVAWTDGNGRFSFGYLPAGRYQLNARKGGYQAAFYGAEPSRRPPATIQLAAGQVRSDFVFRLQMMNSIAGTVLDEDGDPLSGVQVMALTPGFRHQKRNFLPGPAANTDGSGHYRLVGLGPGRYVVAAMRANGPVFNIHPEATAGEPQQSYSYGVQYYPGADHAEAAELISVQPGQQISSIDLRLSARPAAPMGGKIIVPPGAGSVKDVNVNIMSEDFGRRFITGYGAPPPEYRFSGGQFTPGSYVLVAQASIDGKTYRGVQTVSLGPQGAHDIAIPLEASIDLAGSVSVEGPDAGKHTPTFVTLVPGDDIPWNAGQLRANVNKDGSFKITGVPPGIWDINAGPVPPSGYIKSMRLGDQDVLTEEMLIHSSTTEPLKIVISTRAAAIEGDVLDGDQPAHAVVLLAPDGKFRHVISFRRFAATDDKGHFEIKNATPGEYRLYAFEEFDQRSIADLDSLKPFEKSGTPVTLREGPNDSQKLSLIRTAPPTGVPK